MSLLTILDAELAFGLQPLLDGASLTVQPGDRIGLIGRNGTGKSSLLNAIAGHVELDDGEIKRKEGLSIAMVEQEPTLPPAPTLRASLALRAGLNANADARSGARRSRTLAYRGPIDRVHASARSRRSGRSGATLRR